MLIERRGPDARAHDRLVVDLVPSAAVAVVQIRLRGEFHRQQADRQRPDMNKYGPCS